MSDTQWAKDFMGRVKATLPDLLTKHGKGNELAALAECNNMIRDQRVAELQGKRAELDAEDAKLKGSGGKGGGKPGKTES